MLRVTEQEIEIRGTKLSLLTEYTILTHRLIETDTFTKEDIDVCVELALKSEEDVEKEAEKAKQGISDILDMFKNIL